MAHKVVSPKFYLINFTAITVLMILTVLFGKWEVLNWSSNPNGINLLIALIIAIMKATCIVAIFMGVAFNTPLVRTFAIGGFSWLIILFLFLMTDYVNPVGTFGSPYMDDASPGSSPLPGGQSFAVHGDEKALVKDPNFEYVQPHGADHAVEGDHEVEASGDHEEAGGEAEH